MSDGVRTPYIDPTTRFWLAYGSAGFDPEIVAHERVRHEWLAKNFGGRRSLAELTPTEIVRAAELMEDGYLRLPPEGE